MSTVVKELLCMRVYSVLIRLEINYFIKITLSYMQQILYMLILLSVSCLQHKLSRIYSTDKSRETALMIRYNDTSRCRNALSLDINLSS